MSVKHFLAAFFLLLIVSCAPQPLPSFTATPPPLVKIGLDPALDWLRPAAQSCSLETPQRLWEIQPAQPTQEDGMPADIRLQWGAMDGENTPAFILAEDELLIIVHPDNPLSRLSLDVLAAVFTGEIQTWNAIDPSLPVEEIQVLGYDKTSLIQNFFDRTVLVGKGGLFSLAQIAPDPSAMRDAVAHSSATIGILPARWLDERVKPLALDGLPGGLTQPVLAITAQQPNDAVTAWLVCLQQRLRR